MSLTVRKKQRAERYADAVVEVLVEMVPTFQADEHGVVREAIVRRAVAGGQDPTFEVIVDHPVTANWRLRSAPDGRVRLADFGYARNAERRLVEARVNSRLGDL